MAARILHLRATAPVAATAAIYLALPKATIFAEAPPSDAITPQRKPIYDDTPPSQLPPINSSPTPISSSSSPSFGTSSASPSSLTSLEAHAPTPTPTSRLATQISRLRRSLHSTSVRAEDSLNASLTSLLHLEHSFTSTLASLAPPPQTGEKLGPGLTYVLVAGMAASIAVRNRSILLRGVFPPLVAVGAAWYLIPNTMRNVSDLVWEYEKKWPQVANTHVGVQEGVVQTVKNVEKGGMLGAAWLEGAVKGSRESLEGWVRKGR